MTSHNPAYSIHRREGYGAVAVKVFTATAPKLASKILVLGFWTPILMYVGHNAIILHALLHFWFASSTFTAQTLRTMHPKKWRLPSHDGIDGNDQVSVLANLSGSSGTGPGVTSHRLEVLAIGVPY